MQTTISSSCYDAIVIKQESRTYRSTPFQVVFSSNLIKQIQKNRLKQKAQPYKLSLFVNNKEVDVSIKIDQSGRVVFQKVYNRKMSTMVSDSSDMSDQEHSHKSSSHTLDTKKGKTKRLQDKLQEYKNQHAPPKFWQFAWLFNHKKDDNPPANIYNIEDQQSSQTNLTKIKEQAYQGEQHSKEPLFHLSLCGNLLKKKDTKQDILKTFYDHRVQYSQFIKDPPGYINDSNLIVKIDDSLYTWQLGIAILTCRFAYGRDLTKDQIQDIIKNKFTKSRLFSFISGGSAITKLDITQYEAESQIQKSKQVRKMKKAQKPIIKYGKTPDTGIVKKMKLKYGKNIAKFQLDVGDGYKETVTMKIFLWDHSQKIVISDIDGTITKSDILGQILNKWIHTGVTRLFTQIFKRHYKIIYLTARAIGQYQQTSKFLQTVEQDNVYLPEGPLMMSPDGYYRSFTREVIYKTPDYLKTKILASLNQVFPNTKNPIYCGFGNRETDSTAYLKINIAPDRIFCITDKSIISRESDKEFSSTYKDILTNINDFFPQYFKDNQMVDSSDEDVQEYHAVQAIQQSKKTKSVEGDCSQTNLQGYELEQLSMIGNQSKTRKSQHQIAHDDLKSIEQLMKQQQGNSDKVFEHQVLKDNSETAKVTIEDPATTIISAIANIADPKSEGISSEQVSPNKIVSKPTLSKQEIQSMVKQELKQENQVPENQVIDDQLDQKRVSKSKSRDSNVSSQAAIDKEQQKAQQNIEKQQIIQKQP